MGDHELIDSLGNINLPAGAGININNLPLNVLPDQTDQVGKYLTTNGADASWDTITQYSPPTDQGSGNFLSGDGTYKTVTVPTLLSQLTNDSGYQTGAQVASSIAALIDTAPSTLDTLNELATALGNDANFATTVSNQVGTKWTQDNTKIVQWDNAYSWGDHHNHYLSLTGGTIDNGLIVGTQGVITFSEGTDYMFAQSMPGSIWFINASAGLLAALASLTIGSSVTFGTTTVTVLSVSGDRLYHDGSFLPYYSSFNLPGNSTGSLEVKGPITQLGKQVLHTGNASQYALPLTGGSLTGTINFNFPGAVGGTYPAITLTGNEYSGGLSLGVEQNTDRSGGGQGVAYFDSIGGKAISFGIDDVEKMRMNPNGTFNVLGSITQAGNQVLHAGNYSSYTYSIAQVDTALALKANQSSTYTKTEVDTSLALKADITTVNTALSLKADQSTTYTKTQVDTSLALKANQSSTYTKTEVDTSLSSKADTTTVNSSLALKADQSTTYTKTQVDTSLGLKLNNAGGTMTGQLNMTAHIIPTAGATYDLGSSTVGWRNVYTNDLHLSNDGHDEGNSVDGTRGNWTIQEGLENLYIINNKSGKKYKFALEEIL